jgi:preprotein translocase SecF subunit
VIVDVLVKVLKVSKFHMMQLFRKPSFDFAKVRFAAYIISAVIIGIGMSTFVSKGAKMYGVEFSGGTIQQFRFQEPPSLDAARNALKEIGLGSSAIQEFGDKREIIIRTGENTSDAIITKFQEIFKDNPFEILSIESIGPTIGRELRQKALWAVFYSLIGILLYVGFRFEFKFAVAGIAALFHDAAVCLGAVALTGRELTVPVIAAILTIIGYSINDTIVIFDRIRERKRLFRKHDIKLLVNDSVNQTLSRTLLTTITSMLVVLSLYFFGGEVINDFAFVLLVGMISGTYSTVYVASGVLIDWPGKKRTA